MTGPTWPSGWHDPALDTYRVDLDEFGQFDIPIRRCDNVDLPAPAVELREFHHPDTPADERVLRAARLAGLKTEAEPLPYPRVELREAWIAPRPVPDFGELVVEWGLLFAPIVQAYSDLVDALVPQLAHARKVIGDLVEAHPELLGHPADPREAALDAKRAPGRTGPTLPGMDGRRR